VIAGWIVAFGRFWYRFVIGDDWTIAALVALGLVVVYALAQGGVAAWWLMPVVVPLALGLSLWRARRQRA
jgi:hypothetical protein